MPGLTVAEKNLRDWERLIDKLSDRALRSMSVYLLPREVQILVASMDEITTQAMLLQKVIEKYPDLWTNLVETLNAESSTVQDVRGVQSDDGVDPENLHNALTPERSSAVAGGAGD